MENKDFAVSIVVCCYMPDYEKLFLTLQSIILQEKIEFEIIVTDDGTPNFNIDIVENFFAECDFNKYQILTMESNSGTCSNLLRGIQNTKFEYIKPISPGDMLCEKDILYKWVNYMRENNLEACFSKAFYYRFIEQGPELIVKKANPQLSRLYCENHGPNFYKIIYFVVYDPILGAATILKKDIIERYLTDVKGKIIYVEDAVYALMIYDGVKFGFFNKEGIWYEYGSGISTIKEKSWVDKMNKDNEAMKKILLLRLNKKIFFDCKMCLYLKYYKDGNLTSRVMQALLFPSSLYWKINKVINASYTNSKPGSDSINFFNKIVNRNIRGGRCR